MPCYARDGPVGVVHLGLGAFHRAHQVLVFDALLRRGDTRWGVLGVAMRNTALVASGSGVRWQVSGAVLPTDTRLVPMGGITPENMHSYLAAGSLAWVLDPPSTNPA